MGQDSPSAWPTTATVAAVTSTSTTADRKITRRFARASRREVFSDSQYRRAGRNRKRTTSGGISTSPSPGTKPTATPSSSWTSGAGNRNRGARTPPSSTSTPTTTTISSPRTVSWSPHLQLVEWEGSVFRALPLHSVAEGDGGVLADPLPHRHGAAELGAGDERALVQALGLEADRADEVPPARRAVALQQGRQRRAAFAGRPDGDPVERQAHRLLGEEHQRLPALLGGADGDEEGDGDLLGVLESRGQADDRLVGHGSSVLRAARSYWHQRVGTAASAGPDVRRGGCQPARAAHPAAPRPRAGVARYRKPSPG